ncbi:MAG: hypothetical protein A2Y38_15180 [Spirochaetes bacterium GWB1_59_5]|nr:MAG: hypothetical protein A2Y38_15180 [Spirochaetes bacterium GWB1_59_5]
MPITPPDTVSIETALRLKEAGITRPIRRGDWVYHTIWEWVGLVTSRNGFDIAMVSQVGAHDRCCMAFEYHISELMLLARATDLAEMAGQEFAVKEFAEYLLCGAEDWKAAAEDINGARAEALVSAGIKRIKEAIES